jgi:hypothetical protein
MTTSFSMAFRQNKIFSNLPGTDKRTSGPKLVELISFQTSPKFPHGAFSIKKGTPETAGIPFVSKMVPKAGFEPARVSTPPPHTMLQALPSPGGTFRSASAHLRRGGVTRVVTITMMTTAE